MFKIGYRTLKTALGTALAIYIAQMLGLQNYSAAGIITILCIQVTKKGHSSHLGPALPHAVLPSYFLICFLI